MLAHNHRGRCVKGLWHSLSGWLHLSPVSLSPFMTGPPPTPPLPPSTCQRGGMTGDKARMTDSDRAPIPPVRHGQGAAFPCVTLSDRVESCARGGMMQRVDRICKLWLTFTPSLTCIQMTVETHACTLTRTPMNAQSTRTHVSANRQPDVGPRRDRRATFKVKIIW